MKKEFHPKYYKCEVVCNCGEGKGVLFTTRSTVPEIKVEICSQCHPFFTGTQKIVDTAGRVEKFNRRFAKSKKSEEKAAAEAVSEKATETEKSTETEKALETTS